MQRNLKYCDYDFVNFMNGIILNEKTLSAFFKEKPIINVPTPTKSVFGIHDPKGLSHFTQLRISKLNFHKFKHNFRDTINPMCPTTDGIEDTEHFLLLCPSFDLQPRDLLDGIVVSL